MNIPWAENNERHQAQGWATSVMTSYGILWRHRALFDVIICPMTSLRKFLILAPNGAHCFSLRIRFLSEFIKKPSIYQYSRLTIGFPWTIKVMPSLCFRLVWTENTLQVTLFFSFFRKDRSWSLSTKVLAQIVWTCNFSAFDLKISR